MARTRPGRSCPRHYRYSPAVFARAPDLEAQPLYIVGGLYGNPVALENVLAMHLVAEIGGLRIGIVHGDAESLAGWQFSQEALREHPERARAVLAGAGIDVFACTHTCLPVMQEFSTPRGAALIVNNGAAGMPNFRDTRFGLATRIASAPSTQALYGTRLGKWVVEAVPVRYDYEAWIARFDRLWPAGSPASLSYLKRIPSGPDSTPQPALPPGPPAAPPSRAASALPPPAHQP